MSAAIPVGTGDIAQTSEQATHAIVPREPTAAMLTSHPDRVVDHDGKDITKEVWRERWIAMFDAAVAESVSRSSTTADVDSGNSD
jgi:hypothetical protein